MEWHMKCWDEPFDRDSSLNTYLKRVSSNLELLYHRFLMLDHLWLYSTSLSTCIEQTDMKDYFILSVFSFKQSLLKILMERRENFPDCQSERKLLPVLGHKEFYFKNLFLVPGKFVSCIATKYMMVGVGNQGIYNSVFINWNKFLQGIRK